ncbi:DNA primase [Candidatus Xianfuyuplasma coldseepsis]|uniref:DNA primase n=1 Tax=Candidatus Xianfuyuplasma coldseepsis TaxID=2782163 RepID=A0A7L7KUJ1_9MOLU|nr:DNA primase [Xianfuyuplasma coldseepsis]QMS85906.1 DNA primase [Xianfuyuplasma coldseepsis]
MPKIQDATIKEILAKTDIVDLIGETVTLSKQGKSYFGLCPFHSEKTPSFSVEPDKQFYHCFSCGETGDAITFVQKINQLSFVEAVESLADRANMNLDFGDFKKDDPHKRYYEINLDALHFYKLYLSNTKQGLQAQQYLLDRGIDQEIIRQFDIGLAPGDYDVLTKTLSAKGILLSDLHDLGLTKEGQNDRFYDLFRNRIIIPIKDERGRVVAFSGRVYQASSDTQPKYINSPQTTVFTKSSVLFNLHNAIPAIQKHNRVVLFEGYMDVIAAHRSGITESVASMGTSFTKEQVQLIRKYTKQITICYDGDPAGIEATSRAINLCQNEGLEIKIVVLPDRMDPDDYIQKYGTDKLLSVINDGWIDIIEFNYLKNNMDIDFTKMLDIERFKKTVFDLIKNTSHTIIETYIKRLAQDTKISVESIRQDFEQYTKRNIKNITKRQIRRVPIDSKYEVAERYILNYFLDSYKYVEDFNREFNGMFYISDMVRDLRMMIEDMYFNLDSDAVKEISIVDFEQQLNDEQRHFYESKVRYKGITLDAKEYLDFKNVLNDYLKTIQIEQWNEEIRVAPTIQEKIKLAEYRDLKLKEENRWIKRK